MLTPPSVTPEPGARTEIGRKRPRFAGVGRPGHRKRMVGLPNFRDYGLTVERQLMRLICNLVKRYGVAFASESWYRMAIGRDFGHAPGVDTVRHALRRLARRGVIVQFYLGGGEDQLPDGRDCDYGTRLVFLPQTKAGERALALARELRRAAPEQPLKMPSRRLQRWTLQDALNEQARAASARARRKAADEWDAAAREFWSMTPPGKLGQRLEKPPD